MFNQYADSQALSTSLIGSKSLNFNFEQSVELLPNYCHLTETTAAQLKLLPNYHLSTKNTLKSLPLN